MDVEEVLSHKNGKLYLVGGFLYEVDKKHGGRLYCRCIRTKSDHCPARVTIDKDPELAVVKMSTQHSHGVEDRDLMRRNTIQRMKNMVSARPDKSCQEVYREALADAVTEYQTQHPTEEIGATLPMYGSVRSALQRHRAKDRPTLPQTLADIILEGQWATTKLGVTFLMIDDGTTDRMLGFLTEEALTILCGATAVFMDGTFRIVPSLFYYEVAALKAIEQVFPTAAIRGCAFHFCQAVWRNVQRHGLSTSYSNEASVKRFIKSTMALCFVPLERIDDAWMEIDADSPGADHEAFARLSEFKEYFIRTWLENDVFPRAIWNHHGNFEARTTNHLEGWHNALNKMIKKSHSNIFELVAHLKVDENDCRLQRVLLSAGNPPKPVLKKHAMLNARLVRLTEQFQSEQISLIEYVRNTGFNLQDFASSSSSA
ncbi:uncharacterized protein LOC100903596 [Galendromus occidentalis]|uniref:Uncharacterized protein LOC100903596 n=1 Tax=Galendromus occidentalis TaxID=34638 RepID=A0AAJ6VWX8_9ACAR|nr:uncharacterized protein LOC100903596 [Galendromus occidentalis]